MSYRFEADKSGSHLGWGSIYINEIIKKNTVMSRWHWPVELHSVITHFQSCWAWWSDRALVSLETDDIDFRLSYVWRNRTTLSNEKSLVVKYLTPFGRPRAFLMVLPLSRVPHEVQVNLWHLVFPVEGARGGSKINGNVWRKVKYLYILVHWKIHHVQISSLHFSIPSYVCKPPWLFLCKTINKWKTDPVGGSNASQIPSIGTIVNSILCFDRSLSELYLATKQWSLSLCLVSDSY